MTETRRPHRKRYWERLTSGDGKWLAGIQGASGEDLAALRRGIGREPGSTPEMWPFYTTLAADGRISDTLCAEHLALTLYAVHQRSRNEPVHRKGVGLGSAIRALRDSGRFSEGAVDRRFAAAAASTSYAELSGHLRRLIAQLRVLTPGPGLDYSLLFRDLRDWQWEGRVTAVRRRWGSQYFANARQSDRNALGSDPSADEGASAE